MSKNILLEIDQPKISTILDRLNNGDYAIPQIQRSYVWNTRKVIYLVQSLLKGYPIGCFVIWRTKKKMYDQIRTETDYLLIPPFNKKNRDVQFVIDGQQRMSSLYSLFQGISKKNNKKNILGFDRMFWDPASKSDADEILILTKSEMAKKIKEKKLVPLKALFDEKYRLPNKKYLSRTTDKRNMILNAKMPILEIIDAPIEIMKEIFVRINSGGMKVSQVDELFAKTTEINLRHKVKKLISETSSKVIGYNNLSERIIFILLAGIYLYRKETSFTKSKIRTSPHRLRTEAINKATSYYAKHPKEFKKNWIKLDTAFKKAVLYLKSDCGVCLYEYLPSDGLLVIATLFHFWSRPFSAHKRKKLNQLFWVASVHNRYSGKGYDEFLWKDIATTYDIATGKNAEYDLELLTPINLNNLAASNYKERTNIVKAVKCLLVQNKPQYLYSEGPIPLWDQFIKSDVTEWHHIFPDALLKENRFKIAERNTLMNICCIPSLENKKISKKAPRMYLKNALTQSVFRKAVQSHLIPVGPTSSVWKKNVKIAYTNFRLERAKLISKKFNKISGLKLFN